MGNSTILIWIYFACGLFVIYFMTCKLSKKHLKKWAEKENNRTPNCTEHQRLLNAAITYPLLWGIVLLLSLVWLGAAKAIYTELPNKIMGNWPEYQGTIVGYSEGYKGSPGYIAIQNGEEIKSFQIRNAYGREKQMMGTTVRIVYNEPIAYILEYEESGSWIKVWTLPNAGKESHVVAKTIVMNVLAFIIPCGYIFRKIYRPSPNTYFKSKILHNVTGGGLICLSLVSEWMLCRAIIRFPNNGTDANFLMKSQLSMLVLICADVLFCILASPKSNTFSYWLGTAKEFVMYQNKDRK